ncbi:MAG: hypothetical protein GKR98_07405 [Boseongicola sp.]|nr:MAG: hypothetical protein GKR98_07405 [Boseongicola sp.]
MGLSRILVSGLMALVLTGCAGNWEVDYGDGLPADVTKNWRLADVVAVVPESLSVSNANTFAPNADIVWHGDPFGDRKAQVAAIVDRGITQGASELSGTRPVTITALVEEFHGVTPMAVARAPAAVHNITYLIQVIDASTGQPLTQQERIQADLEAFVGNAAVASAINGKTQKVRITNHLAAVTRGWLGFGPDQRREFSGFGR